MAKLAGSNRTTFALRAALIVAVCLAFFAFSAFGVGGQNDSSASSSAYSNVSTSSAASAGASSSVSGAASTDEAEGEEDDSAGNANGGSSSSSAGGANGVSTSASSSAAASGSNTSTGSGSTSAGASSQSGSMTVVSTEDQKTRTLVESALSREVISSNARLSLPEDLSIDSGGSVFTITGTLDSAGISNDLYWAGNSLELSSSRIDDDVLSSGVHLNFKHSQILGDVRVFGQSITLTDTVIGGDVDAIGIDISIDDTSAANSYYCGASTISFSGSAKRFVAYGQSIYFDGVVDGDVSLSAQEIVIGPHARISGLLDIRSGQSLETLEIPAQAQISHLNTSLDDPNAIDQIAQIRSAIAPYFQVGSILFVVVAFALLGLAGLWVFGNKIEEANRLVRRYPFAILVLGVIVLLFMVIITLIGPVLVFTIPLSIIVALLLVVTLICCVPFTGSSVALMLLGKRLRPSFCVVIGAGVGGALLFVPYLNAVLIVVSLIYFVGYMINIVMFGHDNEHDAAFYERQADEDAPRGKASGILPTAAKREE